MIQMRFPNGLKKALTLSYDDGVEQDARLMNILDANGLKCTFNLNSGCFPPENVVWPQGQIHRRMSESAIVRLHKNSGHEVAVHGLTHANMTLLPMPALIEEIMEDRKNLERLFGRVIRGAAYAYGAFDDDSVKALSMCGIAYCRTVRSTHSFAMPKDFLVLDPTCHHADPKLMELADRFLTEDHSAQAQLFYLWGHAYEFEAAGNWQVIEQFAAKMGGRSDIWYCTNIEAVDYVNAFRRLVYSADGRIVHNPTDKTLFFCSGQSVLSIAPGEELHL